MSARLAPLLATRAADLGIVPFWTVFAGLLALASAPVLLALLPPLFDYPNHLARIYILIHQPGSEILRQFYDLRWQFLPNLAMDLTVPLLARLMPLAWAGKLFILACFALLAGGVAALHRAATGRWSPWPLFAFLLLYSRVLLWGFLNYLFGVALALVAFALWVALRDRSIATRVAVSAIFALVLFFAHLMAWAVYGVLVAGYELGQAWYDRPWRWQSALRRLLFAGLAFCPEIVILLLTGEGAALWAMSYGRLPRKLDLLFSVFDNYDRAFDIACFMAVVGLAAFAYARRLLVLAPPLRGPLALLALAYLLAPAQLMTASGVDHRLPLVIAAVLAAATTGSPALRPRMIMLVACAGMALFVARMVVIATTWQRSDRVYSRLIAALDRVPEGGRVAVAYPPEAINSDPVPKAHLPTLAIIDRNAFVPTLFANPGQQPVRLTPDYQRLAERSRPEALWRLLVEDRSDPELLDALQHYDDVVVLARHPFTLIPLPLLKPIVSEPDFALLQVVR